MRKLDDRVPAVLLRLLGQYGRAFGASRLASELAVEGIELRPRMVRNYLAWMDARGWTENMGRQGRRLTAAGIEELNRIGMAERMSLSGVRLDDLAFRVDIDPLRKRGRIILNLARLPAERARDAAALVREIGQARHGIARNVALALEGESLCGIAAPYGHILLGTVCNVTLNGVLRAAGIPVQARFSGLLDIREHTPIRFSHWIHYDGSTLDPAVLLIRARLTGVLAALRSGNGALLAGFREIPAVALPLAERLIGHLDRMGLGRPIAVGRPGRPLLGIPVPPGRVGIAVPAGMNLIAAIEEAGIHTECGAMSGLYPAEDLLRPQDIERRAAGARRLHQRIAALMDNPPPDREYTQEE